MQNILKAIVSYGVRNVSFSRNFCAHIHSMKSVRIPSYSGPNFPAFGLNTRDTEYLIEFSLNAEKYGPE